MTTGSGIAIVWVCWISSKTSYYENNSMNSSLDETKINEIKTQLGNLTNNLLIAIESGDRPKVLAAQNAFTGTIASLWTATDEVGVDRRTKAILRLVAGWAINELPKQIEDTANDDEIRKELKLFQRSLMVFN